MTLLPILLSLFVINPGIAAGVSERMTCADINAKLSELVAIEEPDDSVVDEITKLKADYRRSCAKAARKRKTSASGRVVVSVASEEVDAVTSGDDEKSVPDAPAVESQVTADVVESSDVVETSDNSSDNVASAADNADAAENAELIQELFNLDAGLCADGSTPNKFGCCNDEIFKDLGDTVFACCPPQGGDCFPPIQ